MNIIACAHSFYSLREGVDSPERLAEQAARGGHSCLVLTDTNNLYGAVRFLEAARAAGIRPVLGCRLHDRSGSPQATVLVADPQGYTSLCRLLTRLHLDEQPSLTALLQEHAEGLHVLAEQAEMLGPLREAFGKRLWLAVVRPAADPDRPVSRERCLLEAGERLGIRPAAVAVAWFAEPGGYAVYRLLAAVRQGTLLDRLPQRLAVGPEHHLASAERCRHRFRDLPEALVHARTLLEECRSDVLPRGTTLPPAKVPRRWTAFAFLQALCQQGLRRRVEQPLAAGSLAVPCVQAYRQRLAEELHLVQMRELADYFLVVRDITQHARRRGLSMALRGSAGNSLICYLLGITDVDPLRFRLPLERFLHPGRPDLPDIDLDFDWKVRDEVLAWVFRRYGEAHTAMISSHLHLRPASAFREAAKVHGLSNEQISRLLEQWDRIPEAFPEEGLDAASSAEATGQVPPGFPLSPERWSAILSDTQRLLGLPHHLSIHPGGVVITPRPVADYVPLQRAAKGVIITQFDKDPIEQIGLVKIDLLGNRALSTVDETRRWAARCAPSQDSGADPQTGQPAAGGQSAVELLCRGDTLGINQLESPAMRHLLVQMQPRGLDDVIQALALIRPGAASIGAKERFLRRRRGVEPTVFDHPRLQPLLADTHGLMLYEDDALSVIQCLTGLSPAQADHFRRQISKCRSPQEAESLSREFLQACASNGVDREAAARVWVQLAKFNSYSFCKSHAVSYGLIAWKAAQWKASHPAAFWCAALNNNQGMYPLRVYVEAVKRAGIPVLLPCVNRSEAAFALEACPSADGSARWAIRTGLGSLRELEQSAIAAILAERQRGGPFASLGDFCRRVRLGPQMLALLVRVGAFDFTGKSRPELWLEAEMTLKLSGTAGSRTAADPLRWDQARLLPEPAGTWPRWSPEDYDQRRRWRDEWETLGFLPGPPLFALFRPLLPADLVASRDLPRYVGRHVGVAGLVATARATQTKHGQTMLFLSLEDEWGLSDVTFFPGRFPAATYLGLGPYLVWGRVEEQFGVVTLTATRWEKRPVSPWPDP
jgi:DNA-directed DNA polymerase III PolC